MGPPLRIRVEFLGPFELDFGAVGTEVTLAAPATVGTLLEELARRAPGGQKLLALLGDEGSPRRRYCYVSVDHTVLAADAALEAPLHDGARVCFGMPMVGG